MAVAGYAEEHWFRPKPKSICTWKGVSVRPPTGVGREPFQQSVPRAVLCTHAPHAVTRTHIPIQLDSTQRQCAHGTPLRYQQLRTVLRHRTRKIHRRRTGPLSRQSVRRSPSSQQAPMGALQRRDDAARQHSRNVWHTVCHHILHAQDTGCAVSAPFWK